MTRYLGETDKTLDTQLNSPKTEQNKKCENNKENMDLVYLRMAALASTSASEIPFRIASSISLIRLVRK